MPNSLLTVQVTTDLKWTELNWYDLIKDHSKDLFAVARRTLLVTVSYSLSFTCPLQYS